MSRSGDVPRDFDGLRSVLAERRSRLPKRLAQVAEFVAANPNEMALGTAATIADLAGVQPSTLVRFAQAIGYEGFTDLQQVFRSRLVDRWPSYQKRLDKLAGTGSELNSAERHLDGLIESATSSLVNLRETIDLDRFNEAAQMMSSASRIYLLGQRRVFPVAAYWAYALGGLDIAASLVDNVGALGPEQAKSATPNDVLIAITFTPYGPLTLECAGEAFHRNVPVVAITDSPFSPLVDLSTVWLEVTEADYGGFRSLASCMTLAMALSIETAELRRKNND